jgi:hypothetical protein
MYLFAVALIANCLSMGHGENGADFMPDGAVAIRAFDLMICHMFFMYKLSGIPGVQDFRLTMALDTFPLRDMAVSLDDIDMTPFTGNPSCNILFMVKIPAFDFNISFGLNVAGSTTTDSTRNAFLLSSWASSIIMTGEAVGFVDGKV